MKRKKEYKRPVYLNCVDLDNTLTNDFFMDEVRGNAGLEAATAKIILDYENIPQELINSLIRDTPCSLFAKILKMSLSLGDKNAIVTFNTSQRYCLFIMALFGLTEEEIGKFFIRRKGKTEVRPDDKNGYIAEASDHFQIRLRDRSVKKSLIDDDGINCMEAKNAGINHFAVPYVMPDISPNHYLNKYRMYLALSVEDVDKVSLPSARERFDLAKRLFQSELTVSHPHICLRSDEITDLEANAVEQLLKRGKREVSLQESVAISALNELPTPTVILDVSRKSIEAFLSCIHRDKDRERGL